MPRIQKPAPAPVNTGTLTLNQTNPSFGDKVNFNVTANVLGTGVRLTYSQKGAVVAQSSVNFNWADLSYTTRDFGLYAPNWLSGAADCVADLITSSSNVPLASVTFVVAA